MLCQLKNIEQQIAALTAGQVDAVVRPAGQPDLLHQAEDRLQPSESEQRNSAASQTALLDALPAQVVLLDAHGTIVSVNRSWQRFAVANGMPSGEFGVGQNYLAVCDAVIGAEEDDARRAAEGIRTVLSGCAGSFELEYPCDSATEPRWFRMTVTPLALHDGGAVVMHVDISKHRRAELERDRERHLLRTVIDALSDVFYTTDAAGRFEVCNTATLAVCRLGSKEQLIGKTVFDIFPPEVAARYRADDLRVLAGDAVWNREELSLDDGGAPLWYLTTKVALHDATGRTIGLASTSRDITQQKRAQEQTRQLAERFSSMLEDLSDGFCTLDRSWRITYANRQAASLLGRPRETLVGTLLWELIAQLAASPFGAVLRQSMADRTPVEWIGRFDPLDRWYELRAHPSGQGLAVYLRDVSEPHRLAAQLDAEHARLLTTQSVAKLGSWDSDLATGTVVWSDEMHRIFQTDPLQFRPSHLLFLDRLHPDDREAVDAAFRQSFEQQTQQVIEHRVLLPGGKVKTVEERWQVLLDERGMPVRALGSCQDISERKEAEQTSRALADRLHTTLESITDGFFTLDRSWCFDYLNGRAEQLLGRSRDALLGRHIWKEFPAAVGGVAQRAYERAMTEQVSVSFEDHYAPLGIWYGGTAFPSAQGLAVYFRDITASRRNSEQMRLLETCIAQLNDIVLITEVAPLDEPGPRIRFVNHAFVRITGYTSDEVLGRSPRLLQGPLTDRAELDRVRAALTCREPVHSELVNYSKAGLPYWIELDIVPVGMGGEDITHFVAVERDITERKRNEDALRELNAELESRVRTRTHELRLARDEAQQANQAKSSFLATMSHEIRTPMNGVIGMIDVLHQTSLRGYQVEMVDLIRDSAFSLLKIIEDILDFSKIEAGRLQVEREPLDLADLVEKVCSMQDHNALNRGVQLEVFVDPALPPTLLGDETRIRQVLVNLTGNAVKFTAGREQPGRVAVRALRVERQSRTVTVDLVVSDNGIGIDEATLARLFTPFSQADASTTRRFGGTGLGLAISSMLVRLMGGDISVRSMPGQGSVFTVRLSFEETEGIACNVPIDQPAAGMRCRVIGAERPLADDIGAYLMHGGAQVEHSLDLAAAAAAAAEPAPGQWIWIILPGQSVPPVAELRAMAPGAPAADTRFIVLGRGKRRRPRVEAVDLVSIDAGPLLRRMLFQLLALACGRVSEEVPAEAQALPPTRLPVPSRDEARRLGRLVLVAEDNDTNRKVIQRQLQLIGVAAELAVNGREALERWRSGDFALLLTDLHMPEMDGYALASAIRTEERSGRRTPIIALTANALRDEELRCRAAGMDVYLTKPVRLLQLRAAIEDWLGPAPQLQSLADLRRTDLAPAPPVDLAVLEALVGDDPAVLDEVLQAFRTSAMQSSDELRRGVASGSVHAMAQAAHKLKSAARSIGALSLGELCAEIETATEAGRSEGLAALLLRFEAELTAVYRFLEARAGVQGSK
ncbi:MAG: PAS domain-containing protein [Methylibium sp.]|uniref:PAS domain-containing protein n=1 Tax=Methylibium sp. TaxID=2067992 RepID=UPI0017902E03|nr:PAS domain-containing protein [Methylibium sp.]MBA3597736.1 PAS domain-containing protein [Methylibium sp.]